MADVVKGNKYTVLYFYNQDFSQGCSIEAERFNQALGEFDKRKAQASKIVINFRSPCSLFARLKSHTSHPLHNLLHHFLAFTRFASFRAHTRQRQRGFGFVY